MTNGRALSGGAGGVLRPLALGLLLAGLGRVSAESMVIVEWHRAVAFPLVARVQQALSGGFAFTAGEPLAALLIGISVFALIKRPRAILRVLAVAAGFLVLAFYLSWGFAYQYPPLGSRLASVPAAGDPSSEAYLVQLTEKAARLVTFAAAPAPDFQGDEKEVMVRINTGLSRGFARLPADIEVSPLRSVSFGPVKASRVSIALSRLQISGYYFPWTGEAQINAWMPRTLWPRVGGHEMAHQRGFARENEATVIGLLACLSSEDPLVFYSGALGLFVALDRELAKGDRETRKRIWAALPRRAVADFEAEASFWKVREGIGSAVTEKVNDTYLKSQGVRTGVASYGETTRLILQATETESLPLRRLLEGKSGAMSNR